MRLLRALIIAGMTFFPATLLGLMIWWMLGASYDNSSPAVFVPCNLIPLVGMMLAFLMAWHNGAAYSETEPSTLEWAK